MLKKLWILVAKDAFAQLYGPLAKSQADGMEPIVTAFLEGTL